MDFDFITNFMNSYQLDNELIVQIGGAIVITLASVAIIYKRKKGKKKSKYIILDENSAISESFQSSTNTQEVGDLTIETINFDTEKLAFSKKPRYSEVEKPILFSESEKFVEEALVFDSIKQKEEAISCLRDALKHAEHIQERTRIKIILHEYLSSENNTLDKLIHEFPPLHKFVIKKEFKNENQPSEPIVLSLDDELLPLPIVASSKINQDNEVASLSLEDQISSLAQEAKRIEKEVEVANKDDNSNFWNAFGDMVGDIKKEVTEKQFNVEHEVIVPLKSESQKLWVNWSKIVNGETVLHSDFYEIAHNWGTIEAAQELQELLNTQNSTQCAVLSVFPMLD